MSKSIDSGLAENLIFYALWLIAVALVLYA